MAWSSRILIHDATQANTGNVPTLFHRPTANEDGSHTVAPLCSSRRSTMKLSAAFHLDSWRLPVFGIAASALCSFSSRPAEPDVRRDAAVEAVQKVMPSVVNI